MAISPDDTQIIAGNENGAILGWDLQSGRRLFELNVHNGWVRSLVYNPDGTRFASGDVNTTNVKVWDAETRENLFTLAGHAAGITDIDYSPDGSQLVSASFDGTARIWDAKTGKLLRLLRGHMGAVGGAIFIPPNYFLFQYRLLVNDQQRMFRKMYDGIPPI